MRLMRASLPSTPSSTSTRIAVSNPLTNHPWRNNQATKKPIKPVAKVT
jgi:hypothetical protein